MNPDSVNKVLGLAPIEKNKNPEFESQQPIMPTNQDRDDFEFIRDNYYEMIQKGMEAATELLDFARQSQSARDFEVVATLIKSVNEANRDLADIMKKKKDHFDEKPEGPQTINNNLYVGTTEDIQKLISNSMKSKNAD